MVKVTVSWTKDDEVQSIAVIGKLTGRKGAVHFKEVTGIRQQQSNREKCRCLLQSSFK